MSLKAISVVILGAALSPARAEMKFRYQPEPNFELPRFEKVVDRSVKAFEAQDAFAQTGPCEIVNSHALRRYELNGAAQALQACLSHLATRYALLATVSPGTLANGARGLIIRLPGSTPIDHPFFRDLGRALQERRGELLGYPAELRREDGTASSAQQAIDRCIQAPYLRRIDNAQDFINNYGRCLLRDPRLRILNMRPAQGRRLAVMLLSDAEQPIVESINGYVRVLAEAGPVEVLVMAYPQQIHLP